MNQFTLNHNGMDFKCPNCDTHLSVDWDTEYGDAIAGDFNCECPDCGQKFTLQVNPVVNYTAF